MEETRTVALYTRVSTEDQAKEGFSLDVQLKKLKAYCKARDWRIFEVFVDDGYSGRNTKRPAYKKLLDAIDQWDVLLVIRMDRIHRNSKNFMMMMEVLKKHQKEFVSMMESLDTSTAMGRFVMDIIQRIAQLESEQIGERVYDGMKQKAKMKRGNLGFNIPFGYDYLNGLLTINKDEEHVVKQIFQEYQTGKSMTKIAKTFNKKGIQTKMNKSWGAQTISKILKNPLYCGKFHWDTIQYDGTHEPIIDMDDFNNVQQIIQKRSRNVH